VNFCLDNRAAACYFVTTISLVINLSLNKI
jgi:hypothetical protein